jgi:hypothetical protein
LTIRQDLASPEFDQFNITGTGLIAKKHARVNILSAAWRACATVAGAVADGQSKVFIGGRYETTQSKQHATKSTASRLSL